MCILPRESGMRLLRCNCVAGSLRYTSIPRSPTPCCKHKNHIPFHGRRAKCTPRFHTPCRLPAEQGEGIEEWFEVVYSKNAMVLYLRDEVKLRFIPYYFLLE